MATFWFVLLVSGIISAGLCGSVANAKGLESSGWGMAGFLFGPLALIAVAGMPDKRLRLTLLALAEHQGATIDEEVTDAGRLNSNEGFSTYHRASEDEIWSKAIGALEPELGGAASRVKSEISANNIVIKDQAGRIIARASYAGNTSGPKLWKFRYKKSD